MRRAQRTLYALLAILIFIFGLQLLGESTQVVADTIEPWVKALITGDLSSLGAGWGLAYILLNGATAAAIGIAFLESGLIDVMNTYMIVSGSRLGAAFIVVFIGFLEYIQGKNPDLLDSSSVGILQFIATYIVYAPAIIIGFLALTYLDLGFLAIPPPEILTYSLDLIFQPFINFLSEYLTHSILFITSILLILGSLRVFDRAFKGISVDKFRSDYLRFQLSNIWVSFGLGSLITLLTTSVALSVGIIVPLYNRGYFKRKELIPYLMGANLTTMISSVIAAAVMESIYGMQAVLTLTLTLLIVTLVALLFYDKTYRTIQYIFNGIMLEDKYLAIFVALLILTPILLLILF
ncbi:hypothetical protein [Methanonatronarchaeum sp. AMET6-2]|uniref:hypothetical protein n=1 Tax=Methanonatronarchaeum sp. AMET6-2 TaxID=2933293 RepID=UPI0011FAC9D4|nr:hypothetical protein [Methanonatronarchaeum sp. AMET6-2]RZN63194.1 MAG: sodium:phosphate symporter [Methanonatronarchaeia archaeon]UOY09442.1 hypothetical protein MU439_04085 [Methanonatronarchaeum sp. AMET6-2]